MATHIADLMDSNSDHVYPTTVDDAVEAHRSNGDPDTLTTVIQEINDRLAALEKFFYPVGSLYLTMNANTNPNLLMDGTTWSLVAQGRALVGVGTGQDKNGAQQAFPAGSDKVGEYTHKLTVEEMPSHTHSIVEQEPYNRTRSGGQSHAADNTWVSRNTDATGGDKMHNNIQPSFGVYVWQRTA